MTYQSEVLSDSPLVYWKLDETGAADAAGGPSWPFGTGAVGGGSPIPSDGGTSVHGGGSDAIARRAGIPAGLTGASVSASVWVNVPAGNIQGMFATVGAFTANGWGFGVGGTTLDNAGRQLILLHEGVAFVQTGYTFATGKHHVVITRSAANLFTVYVDGASVFSSTFSPAAATGAMAVGGSSTNGRPLSSTVDVDDLTWFTSVLSAGTVSAIYNSGSGSAAATAAASPAIWLKLNETSTGSLTATDATGNGRVGTHTGTITAEQPSLLGDGSGFAVLYDGGYTTAASAAWMNTTGVAVECRYMPRTADLSGSKPIVSRWGAPGNEAWILWVNNGKVEGYVYTSGGVKGPCVGATTLTAGTAYTVGMSYDGATVKVFVNGVVDGSLAAAGSLRAVASPIEISRVSLATAGGGTVDEVSVMSALSDGRFAARHSAAIAGAAGANYPVTGQVDGSSSVDGSVAARFALDGTSAGASAVLGDVAATFAGSGQADAVSGVQGTILSGVDSPVDGQVDAASAVEGDLGIMQAVDGQAGAVSAVEGDPTVAIGFDGQVSAATGAQGTIVVPTLNVAEFTAGSALDVAPLIDTTSLLGVAEFTATSTLDAGTLYAIAAAEGIEFTAESWSRVINDLDVAIDPVTRRPQYKLVAVDMFGTPIAELDSAVMGTATRSLNGRGGFGFRLGKTDAKLPMVPQFAEVQLWRGSHLVPGGWFVITDPSLGEGDDSFDHQCAGLAWYFEGRLVGKERPELLRNGGFEQGSRYWDFGYSPGSNAETPPKWEITDEACEGGKALRVFADDKVVQFKRTVETQGVFVPNSSTFLSGGEQFIRDAIADIPQKQHVTIEGHTADADGGTGYELSVARANAAVAVAHAARPDLILTAVGKGETEQVASNATEAGRRKNRRVVVRANFTATKVGHRQWVGQSFTISNPAANREPLEIDVQGQGRIDTWGGPSKDGWMLYADVRPVGKPKVIKNNGSVNIGEQDARNVWLPLHTTVEIPADDLDYQVNVRGYPTAGASSFDQMSAMPNYKLAFWQKDPQQVITGLVDHAQDPAFGKSNLNIQGFGNWSGFKIDRAYPWKEHIRVSDAIDEVVRSLNGPDANMLVTPRRRWLVVSPKQGHETGIVLAAGSRIGDARILGYESGVDGDEVATTAIVQSSWSGGGMSEVFARKARADGKVFERLYQAEQDAPVSTLTEQAATAVEYGRAGLITKVTMHPDDTSWLMSRITIGDVVTVDVHDSQVQVRADHRIIQIDLDPNVDQLTYTLAPKE